MKLYTIILSVFKLKCVRTRTKTTLPGRYKQERKKNRTPMEKKDRN